MKRALLLSVFLLPCILSGQTWTDTTYSIQTETNVLYGTATGFAGDMVELGMDISYPANDDPPPCGRPLLVVVHGGAWIAGDKSEYNIARIRADFAKRGYVAAAVNYRLGQFHTNQFVNCNVPDWNCFNMSDSSEWYRANYRGIQDVHGAIRYLIAHSEQYHIDTANVFLAGESAGGFIAMGVGFIDDASEVLGALVGDYPDAPAPNTLYENNCIQAYGLADNIASMNLERPALGTYTGDLNLPAEKGYTIRAVGNFFGGAFNNIFRAHAAVSPALYLFHQPCDLIVPFNYGRLLAGYNTCLTGFPANCGYIVNRPYAYGSKGIKTLIDTLNAQGLSAPEYYYDAASSNYNCLEQAANPALGCHAIDNFWLRTSHLAAFFADKIDACTVSGVEMAATADPLKAVYPNPAADRVWVYFQSRLPHVEIGLADLWGRTLGRTQADHADSAVLDLVGVPNGIYVLRIRIGGKMYVRRLVVGW